MKSSFPPLVATLTLAALVGIAPVRGQNPVPNSPPSIQPHNPPLQPAAEPVRTTGNAPGVPGVLAGGGAASPAPSTTSVSGDYVLSPSDILEMSVFNEPSLTTQTRIGSDGTVQFPLIGEVKVAGMPVRDAREIIRQRYNSKYLVEPQVYLNVLGYAQRRFTVLGQVNRPGTYDFPGGEHLGLLEAIGLAGGFTRLANEGTVQVKRTGPGGDQMLKVNAKKINARGGKPFDLASGDVITVGESWF